MKPVCVGVTLGYAKPCEFTLTCIIISLSMLKHVWFTRMVKHVCEVVVGLYCSLTRPDLFQVQGIVAFSVGTRTWVERSGEFCIPKLFWAAMEVLQF